MELVGAPPGAIVLVNAADVLSGLKILAIDGHRRGDRECALESIEGAGGK